MIVMPANSSGWFWHSLARETGRIGHLITPGSQAGPWPWFPHALDNGAFACWDRANNVFSDEKWVSAQEEWFRLLFWAQAAPVKPRWSIVPDVPGNAERTLERWQTYSRYVIDAGFPLALAVQDGMTPECVKALSPIPGVVAVGGTTEWKWATVETWAREFERVHVLRCNAPDKLDYLEGLGVESCDGTGWNRGDRKQTSGLETWARKRAHPTSEALWPHVCRARCKKQLSFA